MTKKATFEDLLNKKLEGTKSIGLSELFEGQKKLGIEIPSDYCYLLLNSNGYGCKEGYEISLDKKNPIVEIDDFINLEWLIKEREYDLKDEDAKVYREKFIRIASCFNQDRVLMGYVDEVLNEIHLYEYEEDRTVKVSDSIFEFINKHLLKMNNA